MGCLAVSLAPPSQPGPMAMAALLLHFSSLSCFIPLPLAALPTAWAAWRCPMRRLRSPGRWRWPLLPRLLSSPCSSLVTCFTVHSTIRCHDHQPKHGSPEGGAEGGAEGGRSEVGELARKFRLDCLKEKPCLVAPGGTWGLLWALGGSKIVPGGFWGLLGAPGGLKIVPGGSWGLLGPPGGSWGLLGASSAWKFVPGSFSPGPPRKIVPGSFYSVKKSYLGVKSYLEGSSA